MCCIQESVQRMSETMVRETRLLRILADQGPEQQERYQGRVAHLYRQIVQEEGIGTKDTFRVQDANRRARDQARQEVLTGAPEDIIQ